MSNDALTRYRVMAWVTGVLLLVLVFVAVPLKYIGDNGTMVSIVGVAHGWLYMVYLVAAFWLGYQRRWAHRKTILVLLAGIVPFMSFVAERRVMRDERGTVGAGLAS